MSLNSINSISSLQQQLQNMLGPNYSRYLENMQDWFGQRITKEFFDHRMSSILQDGALQVHNEMLKQIIFHCTGTPEETVNYKNTVDVDNGSLSSAAENPASPKILEDSSQHIIINNPDVSIYQNVGDEVSESDMPDYIAINFVGNDELFPYIPEVEPVRVTPILPVDWLFNVNTIKVYPGECEQLPEFFSKTPIDKIPSIFGRQYQQLRNPLTNPRSCNIFSKTPDACDKTDPQCKSLPLKSQLKQIKDNLPYKSAAAALHRKFCLRAKEYGLETGVDPKSTQLVISAAKEHIRKLVTEVIKQRRSFLMRNDKVFHSIGAPYPNPYLRQTESVLDSPYTSDSTKMADVMQVPKLLPTSDELERIATLQIASAIPEQNCRFPANRATLADLLNVLQNDPEIVPNSNSRFKLLEVIAQKYKGFGGSFSETDDDDEDELSNLLPICSY